MLSKALQVLPGLSLYRWTMSPPWGQATFLLFLPEPLLSRPSSSGPASVCMQQLGSHLVLSPLTLGVPPIPGLVSLPDFMYHCSRDVEVFHVAQVRTESPDVQGRTPVTGERWWTAGLAKVPHLSTVLNDFINVTAH